MHELDVISEELQNSRTLTIVPVNYMTVMLSNQIRICLQKGGLEESNEDTLRLEWGREAMPL
jgi:hypothetical protein